MVIQPLLAQDSIFFFSSLASCFLASLACHGLRSAFESLGLQPRFWNQDANAGGWEFPTTGFAWCSQFRLSRLLGCWKGDNFAMILSRNSLIDDAFSKVQQQNGVLKICSNGTN
jgi:hypothetical protein